MPCTRNSTSPSPSAAMISAATSSNVRMNSVPMILRLLLGIGDAAQRGEELLGRVDHLEPDAGGGHVVALDLLALALAQQAVVDEHARELVADRAVHQRGGDRGVDTTGEPAQHVTVADPGADVGDRVVDDVGGGPRRLDARTVVEEALEHRLPVRGVHHLGVPLQPEQAARPGARTRRSRRRTVDAGDPEPGRCDHDRVRGATSTPAASRAGPAKSTACGLDGGGGAAELGALGALHRAAEGLGHHLEAVADAERRHAGVEQGGVDAGRAVGVDAGRTTGEDHRRRALGQHLGHGHARGARSRCRRAPRGRGGRSAARTARRSRRRGRVAGASGHRPADSSFVDGFASTGPVRCSRGTRLTRTHPSRLHGPVGKGCASTGSGRVVDGGASRTLEPPATSEESETMANPTLNEKRFKAIAEGRRGRLGRAGGAGARRGDRRAAARDPRRAHDRQRHVRQDVRRCSCSCSPVARSGGRRPSCRAHQPGAASRAGRGSACSAPSGSRWSACSGRRRRPSWRRSTPGRGRVPRRDLEGVRGPVGRHRLPGRPRDDRRVLRHARALRVRRGEGHPALPDGRDRRHVRDPAPLPVRRAAVALRRRRRCSGTSRARSGSSSAS